MDRWIYSACYIDKYQHYNGQSMDIVVRFGIYNYKYLERFDHKSLRYKLLVCASELEF